MVAAIMPMQAMSLMPVPTKNEMKAPSATWIDVEVSFLLMSISAIIAPRNGPMRMPTNGIGMNSPTISPMNEPHSAALLPPNLRVM